MMTQLISVIYRKVVSWARFTSPKEKKLAGKQPDKKCANIPKPRAECGANRRQVPDAREIAKAITFALKMETGDEKI